VLRDLVWWRLFEVKERVYLGDWLFNAGIVGFLAILLHGATGITRLREGEITLPSGKKVVVGRNYIEFERDVLEGFSDDYFKLASARYPRTDRVLQDFRKALAELGKTEAPVDEIARTLRDQIRNFSFLRRLLEENGVEFPSASGTPEKEQLEKELERVIAVIEANKDDLEENDARVYLGQIYGQKSFLQRTITTGFKEKFREDFEGKILTGKNKADRRHLCFNCGERKAKSGANLDTGLSPFTGVNTDAVNFFWNFSAKLPLCEICELIYFCTFAAFSEGAEKGIYFFVNADLSVSELYNANRLLQKKLNERISDEAAGLRGNPFVEFFGDLFLREELEKSTHALRSIAFIEIDLTNKDILPRVYSFNLSRAKAMFLKRNEGNLARLRRAGYLVESKRRRVFRELVVEILERLLNNSLSYSYLNRLAYLYFGALRGNANMRTYYGPGEMQIVNLLLHDFLVSLKPSYHQESQEVESLPDEKSSQKTIWFMFQKGAELAEKLKTEKAENKIPSLAYKLLSHLRTGDVNGFMNLILRVYLSYSLEVPRAFTETLTRKELFAAYGYSFVNGMLASSSQGNNAKEGES